MLTPFDYPCLQLQTQIESHRSKPHLLRENGDKVLAEISSVKTFHRHRRPLGPLLTFEPPPSPSTVKDLTIWTISTYLSAGNVVVSVALVHWTHLLLILPTCSV